MMQEGGGADHSNRAAAMDPELYLQKHHVMHYIEDAVTFLLERKDEDHKTKPFEVLADYFKSVKNGTNVLFREYSSISCTPHNRASFVRVFWQSYAEVAKKGSMMKVVEYLSLLRLICHDFPAELVQRVAQVIFSHNAMESLLSFPDFLYTFQVVFYYEHFLTRCEKLCTSVAGGHAPHTLRGTTVVVPVSGLDPLVSNSRLSTALDTQSSHESAIEMSKLVESTVFSRAVSSLIQKLQDREPWHSFPSVDTVRTVLATVPSQFTFYDFVLAMSKSDTVSVEIGVLPCKAQLLSSSPPLLTGTVT